MEIAKRYYLDKVLKWRGLKRRNWPIFPHRFCGRAKKIYSIHDSEIAIVKKGKAGVSAEFGNVLLLGESSDGLIVDWKFCPKQAPADSIILLEALERWITLCSDELLRIVVGDRGFDSKKNRCLLEKMGITNAICPRNPSVLKEQLQEKSFCKYQKR